MYLNWMLESFCIYPWGHGESVALSLQVMESHHRGRMNWHLLSCPSTEAVLQTPATLVWPMHLLWECEHSSPISYSFSNLSRGKEKEEGEWWMLAAETSKSHQNFTKQRKKALLQIWNFIPDQFQRAAPDIQSSEFPTTTIKWKNYHKFFQHRKYCKI